MKIPSPAIILDHESAGPDSLLLFEGAEQIIEAGDPAEVPTALEALSTFLRRGRYVAGWLSYELGYALDARLVPLQRKERTEPLLWFGVFRAPREVTRRALEPASRAYAGPLVHEWHEEAYAARFRRAHAYIEAGDIYQVNLSFRSRFRFVGNAISLYLTLRDRARARYSAFVDTGAKQILSLSPELFFEISADGAIRARPMKGTAPRGRDACEDKLARAKLAASPKDRAENLMIVDLMRNDLGRIALLGSVGVRDLFEVETYPTLHTMVSTVTAQLTKNVGPEGVLRALFPCGSITGTPKIRAMEIIRELEESPRGAYCGSIGYFAPDGAAHFNVAIRTITISGQQGELGIGGAVVHDSSSQDEYSECLLKARYFETARRPLKLIETLRYSPTRGFIRFDRHLARMAASAQELGLPFERESAIRALEKEVCSAMLDLRVRITIDEAGIFETSSAPLAEAGRDWNVTLSNATVHSEDELLRHKTDWRDAFEREHQRAAAMGLDEVLFRNERGELTEGSRSNLFVARDGSLITPPLGCGLLNGCLRQDMLEQGQCREGLLFPRDLDRAEAIYLGNSLRGLIRARLVRVPELSGGSK
jgi:para-aminobenzoate synthetase/4-amino-4-deoxychorismate lyase